MPNVYHVVPRDEQWAVKLEGRSEAVRVSDSRADAILEADAFIRSQGAGRVVIHKETGAIESVHTYDTLPPEPQDVLGTILTHPVLLVGAALAVVGVGVGLAMASRR